ncbi:MAG TPA: hypothetical protein VIY28_00885 [Pseudonocardiaceae bacterium]
MTTGKSGLRRRTAVSLPVTSSDGDSVAQFDGAVDALHKLNRALPTTALGAEEVSALGGLLCQISGALLTLTDLLSAAARHHDHVRLLRAHTDTTAAQRSPQATTLLRDCRGGYLAAYISARAFHADLKHCPPIRAHQGNGATGQVVRDVDPSAD